MEGPNIKTEAELTEEEKKSLKTIKRKFCFRLIIAMIKNAGTLFLGMLAISIINVSYVNSNIFTLIGSFLTYFFCFRELQFKLAEIHVKYAEESLKILSK